jgi:hypothetical protein
MNFFRKLPLNRKVIVIMALFLISIFVFSVFIHYFFGSHNNEVYDSLFQITLGYYFTGFSRQMLILFIIGLIVNIDLEYELKRFTDKTYIGVTNLGNLILLQCFISFIYFILSYDNEFFEHFGYNEGFRIKRSDFDIYRIDFLLFTALPFILCFLPHLFTRHRRTLMKVEDTDKKIDELSQQIKELSEQLQNKQI